MDSATLETHCIALGVIFMYLESIWVSLKSPILAEGGGLPSFSSGNNSLQKYLNLEILGLLISEPVYSTLGTLQV